MANLPKKPLYWDKHKEDFYFSVHQLSKYLYALVISNPKPKDFIELCSLNFFAAEPSKEEIKKVAGIKSRNIPVNELIPQISNNARRELLSSHVLAYFFEEFRSDKRINLNKDEPRKLYEDVVSGTADIYKILTKWGEPAAPMLLAKFENISVRTIQNRLRLAREKGLLVQPGSGKRFS